MRATPIAKGSFYSGVPQGGYVYITAPPALIGTPIVGVAIAYTPGISTGNPTPTQQWLLDGQPIAAAIAPTYTPVDGDGGHVLSVREVETNAYGSASMNSAGVVVSVGTAAPAISTVLAWNASAGATSYRIYRGTTSGVYTNNWNVGNVTEYDVNLLTPAMSYNTTYYFAIAAIDGGGEGAKSAQITVRNWDQI